MKRVELSLRLQAVLDFIPRQSVLADIGTDHAWLLVAAVQQERVERAIGGEYNQGPFQTAIRNVAQYGLLERIQLRKGDGLQVLSPGEVNAVSICGMGGALMRDLLQMGQELKVLEAVDTIVTQPNIGEELVREWARQNGWQVEQEKWIEEDGRIYPILQLVKHVNPQHANPQILIQDQHEFENRGCSETVFAKLHETVWLDRLGIWNLKDPSDPWRKKWRSEWAKTKQIIENMAESNAEDVQKRANQLKVENDLLAEVLEKW